MCEGSFSGVSGSFKEVSRKLQEYFKKMSRLFSFIRPEKSCKRCKGRLLTFCWKPVILRTFLGKYPVLFGKKSWRLRIRFDNYGCRAVNWGWIIKIWGFHHARPTNNSHISGYCMSQLVPNSYHAYRETFLRYTCQEKSFVLGMIYYFQLYSNRPKRIFQYFWHLRQSYFRMMW